MNGISTTRCEEPNEKKSISNPEMNFGRDGYETLRNRLRSNRYHRQTDRTWVHCLPGGFPTLSVLNDAEKCITTFVFVFRRIKYIEKGMSLESWPVPYWACWGCSHGNHLEICTCSQANPKKWDNKKHSMCSGGQVLRWKALEMCTFSPAKTKKWDVK